MSRAFIVPFLGLLLASCTVSSGFLLATGLSDEVVGQSVEEFRSGWMAETRRMVGDLADPARLTKDRVGDAEYEIWQWSVHHKNGEWDRWEWVAIRNGVIVQVGTGGCSASAVEQSHNELEDFGSVAEDQLSSIRAAAVEQAETDPICGLVRGPQYGADGMVAIVQAPNTSPWRYQGVVLEYRLPHVIGQIDFYLSPTVEGTYEGVNRWWNSSGVPVTVGRCEVTLQSPGAAEFKGTYRGQGGKFPLRLVSQESSRGPSGALPLLSSGTGWFEVHGVVVTNHHVVQDADSIEVIFADGRKASASVAATDPQNDLALLRVDSTELPPGLRIRETPAILGEDVIALGYPLTQILGDSIKMGRGSVSSVSGIGGDATRLQIDAPVHPGNSGGPVLSMNGEVLGVIVARVNDSVLIRRSGVIAQNINYAIKVGYLQPLLAMLSEEPTHEVVQVEAGAVVQDVVKAVQRSVVLIRCKRSK